MPHASLTAVVTELDAPGPYGADDVEIRLAAHPGRVRELSRMLAGLEDSEYGQAHAEELLALAAREREARRG